MKHIAVLCAASALLLTSCASDVSVISGADAPADEAVSVGRTVPKQSSERLFVRKNNDLSDDFIMGCDISTVISLEKSGVKYYDYDGNEADLFKVLAAHDIKFR